MSCVRFKSFYILFRILIIIKQFIDIKINIKFIIFINRRNINLKETVFYFENEINIFLEITCRELFVSVACTLEVNGGDKVDDDDAGVVGDEELSAVIDETDVLFKNLTVGVRIE